MDLPDLSPEKTEILATFQSLTGKEDVGECISILESTDFDLSLAVDRALDHKPEHVYSEPEPWRSPSPHSISYPEPVSWFHPMSYSLPSSLTDLKDLRVESGSAFTDIWAGVPVPTAEDEPSTVVDSFDEKFSVRPNFLRAPAAEIAEQAKARRKFLLVYVHSDSIESLAFCHNLLCTDAVASFVNDNFVSLLADTSQREGFLLAKELKVAAPSVTVLLDSRHEGERVVLGTLSDGCCHTPCSTVEELLNGLINLIEAYQDALEPEPEQARTERLERERMRLEQESAYQESLLIDQARAEGRRQAEDEERQRENEQRLHAELEQRHLQALEESKESERQRRLRELPAEPAVGAPDATKIAVRLPDGTRIERRFAVTDPLQVVIDFVETQPARADGSPASGPVNLATNFPHTVLSDPNMSLRDYKLYPNAMLIASARES